MSQFPANCNRCGAPIKWDNSPSIVKCEFCGQPAFLLNTSKKKKGINYILQKISFGFSKISHPLTKRIKEKGEIFLRKQNWLSVDQVEKIIKTTTWVNRKKAYIISLLIVSTGIYYFATRNDGWYIASKRSKCDYAPIPYILPNLRLKDGSCMSYLRKTQGEIDRRIKIIRKENPLLKDLVSLCKKKKSQIENIDNVKFSGTKWHPDPYVNSFYRYLFVKIQPRTVYRMSFGKGNINCDFRSVVNHVYKLNHALHNDTYHGLYLNHYNFKDTRFLSLTKKRNFIQSGPSYWDYDIKDMVTKRKRYSRVVYWDKFADYN